MLDASADGTGLYWCELPCLKRLALADGAERCRTPPRSPGTRGRAISASGRICRTSGVGTNAMPSIAPLAFTCRPRPLRSGRRCRRPLYFGGVDMCMCSASRCAEA
jgi:hypothetical protein